MAALLSLQNLYFSSEGSHSSETKENGTDQLGILFQGHRKLFGISLQTVVEDVQGWQKEREDPKELGTQHTYSIVQQIWHDSVLLSSEIVTLFERQHQVQYNL